MGLESFFKALHCFNSRALNQMMHLSRGRCRLCQLGPIHRQGDVCPNGVPARVDRGNDDDDSDLE